MEQVYLSCLQDSVTWHVSPVTPVRWSRNEASCVPNCTTEPVCDHRHTTADTSWHLIKADTDHDSRRCKYSATVLMNALSWQ